MTPPTAFSSTLNEASPIPITMRSSLSAILEYFSLDGLFLAFFRTQEMFLRSAIVAQLFFLDMESEV